MILRGLHSIDRLADSSIPRPHGRDVQLLGSPIRELRDNAELCATHGHTGGRGAGASEDPFCRGHGGLPPHCVTRCDRVKPLSRPGPVASQPGSWRRHTPAVDQVHSRGTGKSHGGNTALTLATLPNLPDCKHVLREAPLGCLGQQPRRDANPPTSASQPKRAQQRQQNAPREPSKPAVKASCPPAAPPIGACAVPAGDGLLESPVRLAAHLCIKSTQVQSHA